MAIRAAAAITEPEEILFENAKVSLCLLLNRHSRTLRIFDFRAGADPTKRGYVLSIAQREGVERVFTVVERDEVGVWSRLGFDKEGTIPGFFKRSDAYVLGTSVPNALEGATAPADAPDAAAAEAAAEKTYQEARRVAKELAQPARSVRLQLSAPAITKKAVTAAMRAGRALTRFDAFGRRDVERSEYHVTARGGWSLLASVERQPCFDNAFVEVLTAPRNERDVNLTNAALHQLTEKLGKEGTVACFAFSPVSDAAFAAIFIANGFRRTGTLPGHLLIGGRRHGAFLWTRKLATPADDE